MSSWQIDQLHTALFSAIGALTTALGVLWRQNGSLRKLLDANHRRHEDQLDNARADHIADVKALTKETIALARAATLAPPLQKPSDSSASRAAVSKG